jgi:hypothetical protein
MTLFAQPGTETERTGPSDNQMEQIRELLVGDILRRTEARIGTIEARLKQLEEDLGRRIDALAARIDTLGRDQTSGRQAAFEELSRSVVEMGERIRGLSKT